jgi:hypothetical protein
MKKILLIMLMFLIVLIPFPSTTLAQTTTYNYAGKWVDEKSFIKNTDCVFLLGGSALEIKSVKNGVISGNFVFLSSSFGHRFSDFDFSGKLVNNQLSFIIKNDGWNNQGKGVLTLNNGKIILSLSITKRDQNANWSMPEGRITFVKSSTPKEVKLTTDSKKYFNNYFTYISDSDMEQFSSKAVGGINDDETMIDFGVRYTWLYNDGVLLPDPNDFEGRLIPAKYVEQAVYKFLGEKIGEHGSTENYTYENGNYVVSFYEGDMYRFSQISKLEDVGNGYYLADIDVYNVLLSEFMDSSIHDDPSIWLKKHVNVDYEGGKTALIKKIVQNNTTRYTLLRYE